LRLVESFESLGEIGDSCGGRRGSRGRGVLGHTFTLARVRSDGTYPRGFISLTNVTMVST